ncbi:MAG: hypothetical protein EBS12_02965 [Flavobacteriia bacterium]|nr:hypothetical protein [Flavobacteriia bacterium]
MLATSTSNSISIKKQELITLQHFGKCLEKPKIKLKISSIKNTRDFATSQRWKPIDKFHKNKKPQQLS